MTASQEDSPHIVVFSSLFPSQKQPNAGLFVRERMFRVGKVYPITVVSPVPWFPFQSLLRLYKPGYRPHSPKFEIQEGVEVHFPRFISLPAVGRGFDGFSMAIFSWFVVQRINRKKRIDVIDAHFAYPDGFAATLIANWLQVPCTITLRGTEVPISKTSRKNKITTALNRATKVFSVADALRRHVISLGADGNKIQVIGNGADLGKFFPTNKSEARKKYKIPLNAKVLITIGGLVERKGFHRVIECLPELIKTFPDLHYIVVGGSSPEGDMSLELRKQVDELGLVEFVHFTGPLKPIELRVPLSAADVFVLSTRNEGWANVFLEAMACGLPVVTTQVGGNAEVVNSSDLGELVPFGDQAALTLALKNSLTKKWDHGAIRQYAIENSWDSRVTLLVDEFNKLYQASKR